MAPTQPQISKPIVEHHPDGFGIGHTRPRISWRFVIPGEDSDIKEWRQFAYDVELRKDNSTKTAVKYHVESEDSVLVPWPGEALSSRESAELRVRSYGRQEQNVEQDLQATDWSDWTTIVVGLLTEEDWSKSTFIASSQSFQAENSTLRPIRFRKGFSLPSGRKAIRAQLYITSLGVYEAYINGKRVGNHFMAPGWTSYNHRLNYQSFDVTSLIDEKVVLAVEVGEGWYAGHLSWDPGHRYIYGDKLALLVQLEATLETGEIVTLSTDKTWKCHPSALVTSEIYDGETYDMREEQQGWKVPGFDENSWIGVESQSFSLAKLIASDAPPVRTLEEVQPVDIITSPSGKSIIDFGQNLVGVLRIKSLQLPRDHKLSLTHAEVLDQEEIGTRPLRSAKCIDTIISSGEELKGWSPKFTFHGFRYVEVDGWPNAPKKEDFTALVIHSDMQRRGWFSCSEPLVNKLHENIVWSMRGNFLSIPTDCPQRDERLGWTGDAQVFAPSATFLYDTTSLLSSWLEDVAAEQLHKGNGIPGLVVPDALPNSWAQIGQAVWHDVTVLTPWDLFIFSGDVEILRRQHRSMKDWIDKGIGRGYDGLWDPNIWQLGDWLDPTAPPDNPGNGKTNGVLVADAYLVHVTSIFSTICSILGYTEEAEHYASGAAKLKSAFQHKYITPLGLIVNNTQTALSLALYFKLFPGETQVATAAKSLAREVHSSKFRIATGFAGTPLICHALTQTGQTQLAYRMLLEKHCPSWLYPVTMGATTIWERWDSMLPDGTINPGEMTSFNHYALGSIASWLHATVGGISSTDGWRTVLVRPVPGGTIDHAEVAFDGPYGMVKSSWNIEADTFTVSITIPPNSKAQVTLPGGKTDNVVVGSGKHSFSCTYHAEEWPPKSSQISFWGDSADDCA